MLVNKILSTLIILSLFAGCFGESTSEDNNNCLIPTNEFENIWEITGEYNTFSSPHAADLNGDNILDIVIGTGMEIPAKGSIVAIDGNDGNILWNIETGQEMFSSAQFKDLDNDGELDVLLGGRGHQLKAIDGQSGDLIWSFDSNSSERENWYQFYTGQFINDIDNDGVFDWLTSNGGDPTKAPNQERENGYIMILSGASGEILGVANTPDNMETYMSPVVYNPHPSMETQILFGTGGETWRGSLWSTSIEAILNGDLSNATEIVSPINNIEKGLISTPIILDLTNDEVLDIVVTMFDGRTIAINGNDFSKIWEVDAKEYAENGAAENTETWATPAAGYFSEDSTPDIFVHYTIGEWPQYTSFWTAQIDGATGTVSWMEETKHISAASPLALDLNGDNLDEVIMIRGMVEFNENDPATPELSHEVLIWNPCDNSNSLIFNRAGISIASPLITDLDNDGDLEMITTSSSSFDSPTGTWKMYRTDLNIPSPTSITWGAYMGNNYDGIVNTR